MSTQSIIEKRASRRQICSSFLGSECWFPMPVMSGPQVTVYMSSRKGLKSIDLHLRWNSGKQKGVESAKIQWNNSKFLCSSISALPVTSKKTGKQVTRFLINAPLDDIQDLFASKSVLFSTDCYSEPLQVQDDKLSIILFIAYLFKYERLTDESKAVLDSEIGWEIRMEEAAQKKEEEKEKNRQIQKQKRLEAKEKTKDSIIDPKLIEQKKQACLKEFSARFVNLLITALNNPSDSRFNDYGLNSTYYDLHYYDIDKAYQLIADDRDLKAKFKGISVSFNMLIAFLEKKGAIYKVKSEDGMNYRYGLLRMNEQQVRDLFDGKKSSDEIRREINSAKTVKSSSGCYIATAIYGTYDCPEVWTLRRFRDQTLKSTKLGRAFIKVYYATSPTLVKLFGDMKIFRSINRKILNNWVSKLSKKGFDNKPYKDQ